MSFLLPGPLTSFSSVSFLSRIIMQAFFKNSFLILSYCAIFCIFIPIFSMISKDRFREPGKIYPLNANPTKWSNMPKQFFGKSRRIVLSVFDHFVWLALKGLRFIEISSLSCISGDDLKRFHQLTFTCSKSTLETL